MKKSFKLFLNLIISFFCIITFSYSNENSSEIKNDNLIDETLFYECLDDANSRLDDYLNVDYFTHLSSSSTDCENIFISNLSSTLDEVVIDKEQYDALVGSINDIFDDLSKEEYDAFYNLGDENLDVKNMIELLENNLTENCANNIIDRETIDSNIVNLCSGVVEIGYLLSSEGVSSSAIVVIKGAFQTMLSTVKAWFLTNGIKIALITTAILVITTVVIINWNKIRDIFDRVIEIFVSSARNFGSKVRAVFDSIKSEAKESSKKDFADNYTKPYNMQKQVDGKKAPKEVDLVHEAHDKKFGKPHVHFKDGTSINIDGTIHDKRQGTPKLTNEIKRWLNKNGWCLNGLKK